MSPADTAEPDAKSKGPTSIYTFGPFQLNPAAYELLKDGKPVSVPKKAYQVLLVLVENAGRAVTKDDLMKKVWVDMIVEEANLSVQISALRKSLGDEDETYIRTVPGVGYKFVAVVKSLPLNTGASTRNRRWAWVLVALISALLFSLGIWLLLRVSEDQKLYRLALKYELDGDDEQALSALDQVVGMNPQFAEAYLEAGFIAYQIEQDDKSLAYLGKAAELVPRRGRDFRLKLEGLQLEVNGEFDDALKKFELLTGMFPQDANGHFYLGELAETMNRTSDAEKHLGECIKLDPKNVFCHLELMQLQVAKDDFDGALAWYRNLNALGVNYPYFHAIVGTAYLAKNDFSNAESHFNELREKEKSLHGRLFFRVAKEHLADVALYQGKLNLAKSQLEQAMSSSDSASERAAYAIEIAGILSLLGDAKSARSLISQNIDKDSLDTTRIAAARILATLGARQDVNSLLASIHPTKAMVQGIGPANKNFVDGQLRLAEGKTAQAIRFLNDSYEQDDDPATAYFLARAHMKAADWQAAFGLLDGAVKHKGRLLLDSSAYLWPLAVYYLAVCEEKLGQQEKALQLYETFLQLWEGADPTLEEPGLAQRRYKELQTKLQHRGLSR